MIEKTKRHEIESIYAFYTKRVNHHWNRSDLLLLDSLELSENYIPLAMATTIAFGISIAGLIRGVGEKRSSLTLKTWIGIIGNLIVVGFFVITVLYSFAT